MKTMSSISTQGRCRFWVALSLALSLLVVLLPASAQAAPESRRAPLLREARGDYGGPAGRLNNPWEYGPGPTMSRQVSVGNVGGPRWVLALLVVGFLVVLAAAVAAAIAWVLLKRRRGSTEGGAHQILERRLAEGTINVEEFERRRDALKGNNRTPD